MISDSRITSVESSICFEITPFLYLETRAHQWPRELGFFSSSRNGKGTPLRRSEGGFAAADPTFAATDPTFAAADPKLLFSGFLVRCCKGGLHSGELLRRGFGFAIITVYVDDLNLIGTPKEFTRTTKYLKKEFEIRKLLLTAQSRQKSYANRRRRPLEFEVTSS